MTQFSSGQQSITYRNAVQAVRQVAMNEGLDQAQRAVADALADLVRSNFLRKSQAKESRVRVPHWRRLLGEKPESAYHEKVDDHRSLWNRNGKHWAFISHPYVLETKELREIVKRCNENGLHAQVRADASWHFPGVTVAVIWTRRHTRIIL